VMIPSRSGSARFTAIPGKVRPAYDKDWHAVIRQEMCDTSPPPDARQWRCKTTGNVAGGGAGMRRA
jgi:hypothetical protein